MKKILSLAVVGAVALAAALTFVIRTAALCCCSGLAG